MSAISAPFCLSSGVADRSVLLVTGEYPPDVGGIADYAALLRGSLADLGVRSSVLTRASTAPSDPEVARVVPRWDLRLLPLLARSAPRGAIVHAQYQAAAFDLLGAICLAPLFLRAARRDLRWVTTFHDVRLPYLFPGARLARPVALRLLAHASDAVIVADPADLRWLRMPAGRGQVVPIGSNVQRRPPLGYERAIFREAQGFQPSHLVVAYFGFLNQSKGLPTLARAFQQIATKSDEPATLLVLGGATGASDPTDEPTGRRFADQLGALAAQTRVTGYLPPADLSAWLLAADLALLPYEDGASARRGSLLACAEHGLPIVTTQGPGLAALPTGAVLAYPPGAADALADAAVVVGRSPELRARLAEGSQRIASAVSWRAIARRHQALYQSLG